jgi:hypothetical protein
MAGLNYLNNFQGYDASHTPPKREILGVNISFDGGGLTTVVESRSLLTRRLPNIWAWECCGDNSLI